jgi:hypothetical protein
VEALPPRERDHHTHQSSTPTVPTKSKQDATSETLQVVGILATIPPTDQVQERSYKQAS